MDFEICPHMAPVNKKTTKNKNIRKKYPKKSKNLQFPSIENDDKVN